MKTLIKLSQILVLLLSTLTSLYGQEANTSESLLHKLFYEKKHTELLEEYAKIINSKSDPDVYYQIDELKESGWFNTSELKKHLSPRALAEFEMAMDIADLYSQDDYRIIYDKYRFEDVLAIDAFTTNLYLHANNQVDHTKTTDYFHQALAKYPNNIFILNRGRNLSNNYHFFESNRERLLNGNYPKETIDFFNEIYVSKNFSNYQVYNALKKYTAYFPGNGYAQYLLGFFAYNLEYYDVSESCHRKAAGVLPVSFNNSINYLKVLARLRKHDELSAHAKYLAETWGQSQHYIAAKAYYDEKHYGRTRDELAKIEKPEGKHFFLYGELEDTSNRPGEALEYFKKAYETDPKNKNHILKFFDALTKVRPGDAITFYSEVLSQMELNGPLFIDIYAFLAESKENQLSLEVNEKSVKSMPGSSWMWNNYALNLTSQKKYIEALAAINKSFEVNKPYAWSVTKFVEIQNKISNNDKTVVETELLKLLEKYPEVQAIWEELEKLKNNDNERIKLWESAIDRLPAETFPIISKRHLLTKNSKWKEAQGFLEGVDLQKMANRQDIFFEKAIVYIIKLRSYRLSESEFEYAKSNFDYYLENGGYPGAYHQYMREWYEAKKDKEMGLKYALEHIKYRPNEQTPYGLIVTQYKSIRKDAFRTYKELVYRNPYDKEIFKTMVNLEVRWLGSPINGYFLAQEFKQNFPNHKGEIQSIEGSALSALGSTVQDYTDYLKTTAIGNSKRYVGWLNNSRRKALRGTSEVEFDKASNTATVLLPDGTIFSRTDDPILSNMTKVQIGDQYLTADYDSVGNLTAMKNSNGDFAILEYDSKGQITKMTQNNATLTLEYNEIRKPVKVYMQDVGVINYEYDEEGNVSKVESEQGYSISLKVTQEFQKLLNFTKSLQAATNISNLTLPDLGMVDKKYEELKEKYESQDATKQKKNYQKAAYDLANHLYTQSHTNSEFQKEGIEVINRLANSLESGPKDKNEEKLNVETVDLYYRFMDKYKKYGTGLAYWGKWVEVTKWLDKEVYLSRENKRYFEQLYALQQKIQNNPVRLLAFDEWLPKSDLQNRTYWNQYSLQNVFTKELINTAEVVDVLYRKNGDLIVLARNGLAAKKNGYWEYYQYNALRNSFFEYDVKNPQRAQFTYNGIMENDKGVLHLFTSSGVLVIENEITGKIKRLGSFDGLPIDNISHLASFNNNLAMASSEAVYINNGAAWEKINTNNEKIKQIYAPESNVLWTLTDKAVYLTTNDSKVQKIVNAPRDEIFKTGHQYFTRKGAEIFKLEKLDNGEYLELKTIGNVVTTTNARVYGMGGFRVNDNEPALGVLTDLGISFFKENHFEHFYVDLVGKPAVLKATSLNNEIFLHTSEGFYEYSKQKTNIFEGRVSQVLYSPAHQITYAVIDQNLYCIDNDNTPKRVLRDRDYSHLALDKKGDVIINSGSTIQRISMNKENNELDFEELFYADSYEPKNYPLEEVAVNDIFVDSGNTIWVVTDMSVFKYEENSEGNVHIQEYNFFKDSEAFPSYTHYNYKIYQDLSGDIYLVASNESHLHYNNIYLKGGLLKYNPDETSVLEDGTVYYGIFERVEPNTDYNWFVNSYTKIDEQTAILGTAGGFALEKYGQIRSFRTLNDPSYLKLLESKRALYLGTAGTRLGDLWLFGSEVGVLGYWNGSWFYPEKINSLLPNDIDLGKYGARAITSITTDSKGKVYIGTERGLLIYESGSEDGSGFFFDNNFSNNGIQAANASIVQSESMVLLHDLSKNSNSGKLVEEINNTKKEIDKLSVLSSKEDQKPGQEDKMFVSKEQITSQLQTLQKRQAEILLMLEQTEPAVFQALTIPPLDLQASRAKLSPGDVVVQYIPLNAKLYINLVFKDKTLLKEVNITSEVLEGLIKEALPYLRSEDVRGSVVVSAEKKPVSQAEKNLQVLYDILIKPIRGDIEVAENVLIVPGKFLHYLPFSALYYEEANNKRRYAVQDHIFGYMSSLYLFNLVYDFKENTGNGKSLIVADPDGTLKGALREGEAIANLSPDHVLLKGKTATISNFDKNLSGAKSVHLATHGFLKEESIKDSWLVFSDKKMLMSDVYNLDLSKVNYVVLSACQTAYGKNGLEYAHLGRAFANAGAPSVIATLWSVNDDASEKLILGFYNNLAQGSGKYKSLALAQRSMIEQNNNYSHPAMWAGYITIGKN